MNERAVRAPTRQELARAWDVVTARLEPTPLVRLPMPAGSGEVFAKLETLQPTGSFKVRGAFAAVAAYGNAARIVTASAGNHGLGVAFAAAAMGVPATVVVPTTASAAKVEALRTLGADLVEHGDDYDAAEAHALAFAEEDGSVFLSAYDDAHVIAGQATCMAEVAAQLPGAATVVVPVGGGGLLAGTAIQAAVEGRFTVVGVEAAASRGLSTAAAAGTVTTVEVRPTLADGLAGNLEPGSVTPAIATANGVSTFVAVDEPAIEAAMHYLLRRCGLLVEGAGAVGVAAALTGALPPADRTVVLLTGRNVAGPVLARLFAEPAVTMGR